MTKNDTGFFQCLIWDLITLNKGLEYVFFWFRIPQKPWIKQRLAENKGLSEKYNIQHWWFNLVKQRFPSRQRCDGINSNVSNTIFVFAGRECLWFLTLHDKDLKNHTPTDLKIKAIC